MIYCYAMCAKRFILNKKKKQICELSNTYIITFRISSSLHPWKYLNPFQFDP